MSIEMSKGTLIGNAIFLTFGPVAAAQLSMHFPQYMWPIIVSFVGVRIGIELAIVARRKRLEKPTSIEAQPPRQVAHV